MSDFSQQVRAFSERVTTKNREMFVRVVQLASESIVSGSAITGAPGQPVDTGYLKNSWQTVFDSPQSAIIGTNTEYAPFIEDGIVGARSGNVTGNTKQRLTQRSESGGFHSVALTRAGFGRIVEAAAAEVAR